MGLVSEILAHGGFLPQLADLHKKKSIFNRKNGIMFAIFRMITLMMLIPAMLGVLNGPGELQGLSAVIGVFGGMMIIIGSLVMLPSSKQYALIPANSLNPPTPMAHGLHGVGQHQALPPQQSIPASAYAPPRAGAWRDTNDLEPSSVTESTTKLLEKEDKIQ
jgi:hypothetical protein